MRTDDVLQPLSGRTCRTGLIADPGNYTASHSITICDHSSIYLGIFCHLRYRTHESCTLLLEALECSKHGACRHDVQFLRLLQQRPSTVVYSKCTVASRLVTDLGARSPVGAAPDLFRACVMAFQHYGEQAMSYKSLKPCSRGKLPGCSATRYHTTRARYIFISSCACPI